MISFFPLRSTLPFAFVLFTSMCVSSHICRAQSAGATAQNKSNASVGFETVLGPPPSEGPCVVRATFYLQGVNAIDEESETFEFTGILTLKWKDERQAFDPAVAGVDEKIYQGDFQFNELSPAWYPQVVLVNRAGLFETSATILRVEPDGSSTLSQVIDAVARTTLDLSKMPFDSQSLDANFEVFGFDQSAVKLLAEEIPDQTNGPEIRIPQWTFRGQENSAIELHAPYAGKSGVSSRLVLKLNVERKSLFLLRLVVMPLALIVMLSWSIFWMDRSSLGDRINLSFVGILTAVAYQIVVGDITPHISYQTLMNGFLNISFWIMCAAAIVNLWVGAADRTGNDKRGDMIDRRCRVIFPLAYLALIVIALMHAFFL